MFQFNKLNLETNGQMTVQNTEGMINVTNIKSTISFSFDQDME